MAALMRLVLEKDGWTVHRAADGKGAKELMRRLAPPELVTLDIFLPDASGVDLILNVRDTPGWERVPIVMVTAKPKDKEVNWAIKSGATAYLVKPFRQENYATACAASPRYRTTRTLLRGRSTMGCRI